MSHAYARDFGPASKVGSSPMAGLSPSLRSSAAGDDESVRDVKAWQGWQGSAFVRVRSTVRSMIRFRSTMRSERTWANGRERSLHIDKLGVTGSSPVAPMSSKPRC